MTIYSRTLALGLLFIGALGVRLLGAEVMFPPGEARLLDGRSHLHAKQMKVARDSFPRLPPLRAAWLAYPEGAELRLPPGPYCLVGALARLLNLPADAVAVTRLGTLFGVLLGALAVLAAVVLAARWLPFSWALLAGLLLALWPLHIELSRVGCIDPQAYAPLGGALAALLGLRALERRAWLAAALGCGLVLGASLWLWPGALLGILLFGSGLLVAGACSSASVVFATALLVAAPLCALRGGWAWDTPSWLQLVALAALLLAARVLRSRSAALKLAALGGVLGLVLLLHPWSTFDARAPSLQSLPLWALPLGDTPRLFAYVLLALPLLVALALGARLVPQRRREVLLVTGWTGGFVLAGLGRLELLAPGLALLPALCVLGTRELAQRIEAWGSGRARARLLRWVSPATAIGLLCLFWPACDYLGGERRMPGEESKDLDEAARWLRARAEQQRGAVIAPASMGTRLALWSELPVVAGGVGSSAAERANRQADTFFTAPDPQLAAPLLAQRRVGWVLAARLPAGRSASWLRRSGQPSTVEHVRYHHRRMMATRLVFDLGSGAELGRDFLPAVDFLQHCWESAPREELEPVHLFRLVPGAQLEGTTTPDVLVSLELRLLTNRGRPFTFRSTQRSDPQGRFRLRVPYWSASAVPPAIREYLRRLHEVEAARDKGMSDATLEPLAEPSFIPLGPILVAGAGCQASVQVAPPAVLRGEIVGVRLGTPPSCTGLDTDVDRQPPSPRSGP